MTTVGKKFSYKPATAAAASSVVILKDGRALEVRRGEKTTWVTGEERKCWSSLEEWRASLPANAEVKESSSGSGSGGGLRAIKKQKSADMERVLSALGKPKVLGDMIYRPSSTEMFEKAEKNHAAVLAHLDRHMEIEIADAKKKYAGSALEKILALKKGGIQRCIATEKEYYMRKKEMAKYGPATSSYWFTTRQHLSRPSLFYKAADGSLERIWFHPSQSMFGIRIGGAQKYGTTFAELGLSADVEIWARRVGSESIKRLF